MEYWFCSFFVIIALCMHLHIAGSTPVPMKTSSNSAVNFIILHTNDMHSNFEQSTESMGCKRHVEQNAPLYGGFARVSHVVKQYRKQAADGGLPVLFLNAGDNYVGTPYFQFFKEKIVSEFMNLLKPDAMVNIKF